MTKFEEEFNYLIELSGKVLLGQVDAETFKKNRIAFFEKYETDQQQDLPVVPECVGIAIESLPDDYSAFEAISLINAKIHALPEENKDWLPVYNWLREDVKNQDIFALAFITGKYEVEKPQLFYLKHIDMSETDEHYDYYLSKSPKGNIFHSNIGKGKLPKLKCILKLTQQEIESLHAGSYEQIEVQE